MKAIKFLSILFLWNQCLSQTLKTTYYDRNKTHKMEVYQVDANGEKNGSYKNYDEQGAMRNSGTFKFGKKHGVFIEYTKFPNYAGSMQIKSKETYSNDVLEGIATYYLYDEYIGVYESYKGIYKEGKESGKWARIKPFSKMFTGTDVDYYASLPQFKTSLGLKDTVLYKNGEEVRRLENRTILYYPSNKIYRTLVLDSTFTGADETYAGIDTYYYPDDKIWSKKVIKNNLQFSFESFYPDGKLKSRETANPEFYEGYNKDGSPNNYMIQFNNRKQN